MRIPEYPAREQRLMRPQLAFGVERATGIVEVHEFSAVQPAEFATAKRRDKRIDGGLALRVIVRRPLGRHPERSEGSLSCQGC